MNLESRMARCPTLWHWISQNIDGLKVESLPTSKRTQMSAACFHLGIEHAMAIDILNRNQLPGAAMALVRVAFDAFVRGVWIYAVATDEELDAAGADQFPSMKKLLVQLEDPGSPIAEAMPTVRSIWWRYSSYTHTGYQQIGARFTPSGLSSSYGDDELSEGLLIAQAVAMMSAAHLAAIAGNEHLARKAMGKFNEAVAEPADN